ncbi:hypothetical protein [Burkholderia gladioli]|uniref:hypothetical protein n=1 Tax=Burkholderia gladioli TaxID=28095 RepID=UPI00163ED03E|nr:hypothetical protein [Burkholderia gladioli]
MRKIFAAFALFACAASAAMASDENLDHAAADAVKTFRTGGSDALVARAERCNSGISPRSRVNNLTPPEQVEYCFAFEMASGYIIHNAPGATQPTDANYLTGMNIKIRAIKNAELVRVITLPEQVDDYLLPRARYVTDAVKQML